MGMRKKTYQSVRKRWEDLYKNPHTSHLSLKYSVYIPLFGIALYEMKCVCMCVCVE